MLVEPQRSPAAIAVTAIELIPAETSADAVILNASEPVLVSFTDRATEYTANSFASFKLDSAMLRLSSPAFRMP